MKSKKENCNEVDLLNYKGEYYDNPSEKYQDPITGAHFRYKDVYQRLLYLIKTQSPKILQETKSKNIKESVINALNKRNNNNCMFISEKSKKSNKDKPSFLINPRYVLNHKASEVSKFSNSRKNKFSLITNLKKTNENLKKTLSAIM